MTDTRALRPAWGLLCVSLAIDNARVALLRTSACR